MRICATIIGLLLFVLCGLRVDVNAWALRAHRAIALAAESLLSPAARVAIRKQLASEGSPSLADISTWADEVRRSEEFKFTSKAHFIEIPLNAAEGDLTRYCPGEDCILSSLEAVSRGMVDPDQPAPIQAQALKFFVHLMADIHMPLHCASNGDSSGSQVPVQVGARTGNLHAAWDALFVDGLAASDIELARTLTEGLDRSAAREWQTHVDPATLAWECFAVAKEFGYADERLRAPRGGSIVLTTTYVEAAQRTIHLQLRKAAVRTAHVLNVAFGGSKPATNLKDWLYPRTTEAPKRAATPGNNSGGANAGDDRGAAPPLDATTTWARPAILGGAAAGTLMLALVAFLFWTRNRSRRVFVCYRRKTTQGEAGRMYDRLTTAFGQRRVFRDIDSIAVGHDFVGAIRDQLAQCDVLVAIIGPGWATDARLLDPGDFVRVELETALSLKLPIIPVLVNGADIPEVLPEGLEPIGRLQALVVNDQLFDASMAKLIAAIRVVRAR